MTVSELESRLEKADSIAKDSRGIWHADEGAQENISYPEDGNQECYQIEEESFWFAHRNRVLSQFIKRYPIPSGSVMLDIGGGNGFVAKSLSENGQPVALLEPGYEGCRRAKDRNVPLVIKGVLRDLHGKELRFDAASAFDVVEHIEGDAAFVDEIGEILPPGGLVFVTVPALMILWSPEDLLAGHFRRYTRSSLGALFDPRRWQIEFNGYFFSYLVLPILISRCFFRSKRKGQQALQAKSDHVVTNHSIIGGATRLLNRIDFLLLHLFGGRVVGSSILLVARRRQTA